MKSIACLLLLLITILFSGPAHSKSQTLVHCLSSAEDLFGTTEVKVLQRKTPQGMQLSITMYAGKDAPHRFPIKNFFYNKSHQIMEGNFFYTVYGDNSNVGVDLTLSLKEDNPKIYYRYDFDGQEGRGSIKLSQCQF